MDEKEQELGPNEEVLDNVRQNYARLKAELRQWLEDEGVVWIESFNLAGSPPYLSLFDLPDGPVLTLWQRLNAVQGKTVSLIDMSQLWKKIKDDRVVADMQDAELLSLLHFAISGVARLARTKIEPEALREIEHCWERPVCPVCGEEATLAVLTPPIGRRYLHCAICGHQWMSKRTGCIRCGSENAENQVYLQTEEFPGVAMVVCYTCDEYFKEVDLRQLSTDDPVWEDVRTLPLNYAAENWLAEHAKQKNKVQ